MDTIKKVGMKEYIKKECDIVGFRDFQKWFNAKRKKNLMWIKKTQLEKIHG